MITDDWLLEALTGGTYRRRVGYDHYVIMTSGLVHTTKFKNV